ncbi:MAG: hypothetical protein WCG29_13250 [Desulfomonile sp.]
MGTLQPFVEDRRRQGVKARTVNCGIQVVRRILNLASGEWFDTDGEPWLLRTPKIRFFPETDKRDPYPLAWDEQVRLFNALPPYLRKMALFAVNTGLRNGELCGLRWEWEEAVPELGTAIFIIPGQRIKSGQDRVVVLNSIATG